jgi:hypothetical protein
MGGSCTAAQKWYAPPNFDPVQKDGSNRGGASGFGLTITIYNKDYKEIHRHIYILYIGRKVSPFSWATKALRESTGIALLCF